ncbi:MAG: ECF-type sigma factor [Lentimicrobium sp.]|jgi:RNA polymerase sigma factor (TIGR02999 family)|nr:ECF-type sigma factor [Lentimicrobium sp.]
MAVSSENILQFIRPAAQGDEVAMQQVFPHIYGQLYAIARNIRFNFHGIDTMNTTAIIHEAYLKIADGNGQWKNHSHFYSIAAKAMRQIMLNAARDKHREKRGGGVVPERLHEIEEHISLSDEASGKLIDFEEVLGKLEEKDNMYGRIVECRFYSGLSIAETAEALNVSPATVKRKWQLARDWLYTNLPRNYTS